MANREHKYETPLRQSKPHSRSLFAWVCALIIMAIIWTAVLLIIGYATTSAAHAAEDTAIAVRRAVCVGPIEHYRHGSETNIRVWRDGPNGEVLYDCEFESDTPSGRLIMRVCGPIVDVADANLKLACRIEGLFEIHGGKVRMNLVRADNVKLVRRGGAR